MGVGGQLLLALTLAGAHRGAPARLGALGHLEIGEQQFRLHDLHVAQRIGLPDTVSQVLVLEAAHDVQDRVHLAEVTEELVAQALALAGAGDQPRDVDEANRRGDGLLGLTG